MKTRQDDPDVPLMAAALRQAGAAAAKGEVPVGAVIVRGGKIVAREAIARSGRATRPPTPRLSPSGRRPKKLGNYRLTGCEVFVTVEPCAMCLGAMLQARVKRLVYGADDPKAGAVKSIVRFPIHKTNHRLEIRGGVMADDCAAVLREFFRARRN